MKVGSRIKSFIMLVAYILKKIALRYFFSQSTAKTKGFCCTVFVLCTGECYLLRIKPEVSYSSALKKHTEVKMVMKNQENKYYQWLRAVL